MKKLHACTGLLFALSLLGPVQAGVYTDDLSRCLVEKTDGEDRIALVRWMFSAAAAHPAVAAIATITPEQMDASNKAIAELFMMLLTDACREQAIKALEYEGHATIQVSFQVLGQVAGAELFASPEVAKAMAGLEKHTDREKLEALTNR